MILDIIPPKFLEAPEIDSAKSIEANLYAIDCDVSGVPFPDIAWYKDGKMLEEGNMSAALKMINMNQR